MSEQAAERAALSKARQWQVDFFRPSPDHLTRCSQISDLVLLQRIKEDPHSIDALIAKVQADVRDWLARENPDDFTLAMLYYYSSAHSLTEGTDGCEFAAFLCDEIGPERVWTLTDHLPEGPEKERLELIAAELRHTGGG